MQNKLLSKSLIVCALIFASCAFTYAAPNEKTKNDTGTKLLRYPDINRNTVVFCHGGDIWRVSTKGGTATRLTAHEGLELFPKISPDGKWLAFTGQYDGDEQVYVMPIGGGVPRQLTFYPAMGPNPPRRGCDNIVYGWTPDSKKVLFRSLRDSNSVTELGALFTVSLEGGLPVKLPMPTTGAGDFSPDGKKIVYSPLFRDFRSWKRYQGGWAQYLTIFDLETNETKRLDKNVRTERDPMWIGNSIYFVSDRTGTMNLFKYDIASEEITQCTYEQTWDVRWATSDKVSKIIYELAGELVIYDTSDKAAEDRTTKLTINVPHDGLAMRPQRKNVSRNIEEFALAPGGKRAAVIARGDLFSVPIEKGYSRNLTNTSNAHEREVAWSYDGSRIAYVSDVTGEDQIYLIDPRGEKPAEQLTKTFDGQLNNLRISPCGLFVSIGNCKKRIYVIATEDTDGFRKGEPVEVAQSNDSSMAPRTVWSPCGGYLAFVMPQPQGYGVLYIWELKTKTLRAVTDPMFDVESPAWDPSGKFLYYISRREFAPQYSTIEWNFAANRDNGIFAIALRKDVANPFAPQSDEVESTAPKAAEPKKDEPKKDEPKKDEPKKDEPAKDDEKKPDDEKKETEKKDDAKSDDAKSDDVKKDEPKKDEAPKKPASKRKTPTIINWDGLAQRVVRVPVGSENFGNLEATAQYLVYVKGGAGFNGRESYAKSEIMFYDIKERKEYRMAENASSYELSPDGKRILFSSGGLKCCDLKPASPHLNVPTGDMYVDRVPADEWREMFDEAWRKYRDWFYVENMHGYDWRAIGEQYRSLLPYVAHRDDLNYVIAEMISELNIGHTYVQGGEYAEPSRPSVGLPGCRFELDKKSNRYKISVIFKGSNEEPKYRSPLTELGVDAKVGDYVLQIDGIELLGNDNPYRLLQHRTHPITLTLNAKPTLEGSRKVTYVPVRNETSLKYLDFVLRNVEAVDKATNGRAGYIHLPDMGASGAYEFLKWYYPQIRKEGLVIDDRSNGGGNISQWIIMRLNQKMLGTRFGSIHASPALYPGNARFGHQVCLINETSASDGDIFPHYFRKAGLGLLIGKRTWGGVVGISPRGQLLDGGSVTVPLQATNDENGNWIIEGEGVTPDIEVENDPKSMINGKDPQLEMGIKEILKQMDENPKKLPNRPEAPVKTK
ncbi:MAG: PDZ domain-containing protein [Planctomycetaceae bacterium]|nr:PDZ domain-containing protein [Planctomycetaceae bacterium]